MNRYSAKIKIRKDSIRRDGTALLYLQVIINSKPDKINLNLYWPPEKFSEKELCLERNKADTDANDYNIILRDAVSKANEIFKLYRLNNEILTNEIFKDEYNSELSKQDFVAYMEKKIIYRYKRKEIVKKTKDNHEQVLLALKKFKACIPFRDINSKFPKDFESSLKKNCKNKVKGPAKSSIYSRHSVIKAYLNLAITKDNINIVNPYSNYPLTRGNSSFKSLDQENLPQLYKYYQSLEPRSSRKNIIRGFLFSCCSGLRTADVKRVKKSWINFGSTPSLYFMPQKTIEYDRRIEIPLTEMAMSLIEDALAEGGNGEYIFKLYSYVLHSRYLKEAATKLGLNINMHFHVSRETFGTLYLELGGSLEVLQKLMGHSIITTTMHYVHVSQSRQRIEMKNMEKLFDEKKETPTE
ncbi:site-specific integrase [Pontibacter sp. SGAir0037]|uniref:site-specific integrase n=1 Tax=Pontibacter sp. SGAir0037 TaxID=2571030 RepID=UPI00143DF0CC|nr:site-specific integrase [Pontibacter sp. SGAir0037]